MQADRRGFGKHGAPRGHVTDRDALGLVRHQGLAPAAADRVREPLTRRVTSGDAGLVEALAGIRPAVTTGPAGLEAAVHAGDDRVEHNPLPLTRTLDDHPDQFVSGDRLGLGVEGRHHKGRLCVCQTDVASADAAEFGLDPYPAVLGQPGFGHVRQPHQSTRPPAGVALDLSGSRRPQVARRGQVGEDSLHREPNTGILLTNGTFDSLP